MTRAALTRMAQVTSRNVAVSSIFERSDLRDVNQYAADDGDYSLLSGEEGGEGKAAGDLTRRSSAPDPSSLAAADSAHRSRSVSPAAMEPSEVEEMLENTDIAAGTDTVESWRELELTDDASAAEIDGNATWTEDSSGTVTEPDTTVKANAESGRRRSSLMDGFWACLAPVATLLKSRERREEEEREDDFEIAFADIKGLDFVGSGAQGAVFCGEYKEEYVAVKKVNDAAYCDEIRQLRKLTHRNIIHFK